MLKAGWTFARALRDSLRGPLRDHCSLRRVILKMMGQGSGELEADFVLPYLKFTCFSPRGLGSKAPHLGGVCVCGENDGIFSYL